MTRLTGICQPLHAHEHGWPYISSGGDRAVRELQAADARGSRPPPRRRRHFLLLPSRSPSSCRLRPLRRRRPRRPKRRPPDGCRKREMRFLLGEPLLSSARSRS
jgi:hypothetical protein